MLKLTLAAACLCWAGLAEAQSGLTGQQISDLVAGATVEVETPAGTKLPVRYARDGKVSGDAGGLAWYLGSATDTGRWWVSADQLCHRWKTWFNAEPQCMKLAREGRVIHWRHQDGNTGTARVTVPPTIEAAAVIPLQPGRLLRFAPAQAMAPPPAAVQVPQAKPAPDAVASAPAAEPLLPPPEIAAPLAAPPSEPPLLQAAPALAPAAAVPPKSSVPVQAPLPKAAAPAKQAEPKAPAPPKYRVANVRTDDVLNVRSGPSADFDIVGELLPGSRGIAITSDCQSRWCPVAHRATKGWVNVAFLAPDEPFAAAPFAAAPLVPPADPSANAALRDSPEAPRSCLTSAARALLDRIEQKFGRVQLVSTCRAGALIAGTGRPSRHASGNAVDFKAGPRKAAIVEWLLASHHAGGTMTYAGMDHIHVDIGPYFVSIANGPHWSAWNRHRRHAAGRRGDD